MHLFTFDLCHYEATTVWEFRTEWLGFLLEETKPPTPEAWDLLVLWVVGFFPG